MVELIEISKTYLTETVRTTALNGVNLQFDTGEFVAIMGPSGCGKSTLLSVIGMLDRPSAGRYLFCGEAITEMNHSATAKLRKGTLAFIFQSFNLIDELTACQNIELPLTYLGWERKERYRRAMLVLDQLGLAHRADHRPSQLSGGQQQRVAVARALAVQPKLVLADEPAGNLDSVHGHEVMGLLKELNITGTTILMVTHSQEHADYASRVVTMRDGRVGAH